MHYSTVHVATRQMKNGYVSFMLTTVGQFYHQVDSILLPWEIIRPALPIVVVGTKDSSPTLDISGSTLPPALNVGGLRWGKDISSQEKL